ncbi:MAG TPA: hypothetical protein VFD52_08575 [Clostridia bacterium]|nr:hypothetical protein [Clostridia bacterium]
MKVLKILILSIALIFIFSIAASATEKNAMSLYDDQLKSSGIESAEDSLPKQTKEMLDELGIQNVDFNSIFNTSPRKIIDLLINIIKGEMNSPLNSMAKILGILILMALANSFIASGEKEMLATNIVCGAFILIIIISPLTSAISGAVSSVSALSSFMLVLIPILAGIITASGNPLLALSFNSVAFASAQVVSQIIKNIVVPCTGVVMSMGTIGAMTTDFKLDEIAEIVKKVVVGAFSAIATLFSAFLSIKGILANAADTVAAKGIKLAISGAVPIVGSTLADSYSSIIGSVSLVKSTVGVFGIGCVLLISAPIIIELTMWSLGLKLLSACSEMFGIEGLGSMFKAVSSGLSLLNVCLIFNMFLMIITLGITLAIKVGV